MPNFTTDEMAHKTTLHTGYHNDILQVWRAAIMRTKCRVEKCSIVHQLPEEKLWRRQEAGEPSSCQLCSECAHLLPQNLVGFKKKKQATVLVNCNFWLHHNVLPVSFASYSFATDKPDTGHWMQGTAPHSGMGTAGRGQKQSFKRQWLWTSKGQPHSTDGSHKSHPSS